MNVLDEELALNYDLVILGLGYESRSIYSYEVNGFNGKKCIALGYDTLTEALAYQENKQYFEQRNVTVFEGDNESILTFMSQVLNDILHDVGSPPNVFLDISVMSRPRLALVMMQLFDSLPESSYITISYSISGYLPPPDKSTPLVHVGPLLDELSGGVGGINKPVSLVISLGYEKNKALGIANYFDCKPEFIFCLIPISEEERFEEDVLKNNQGLLSSVPEENIFRYDTNNPYDTYLNLKELYFSLNRFSRPVFVPLGPKIISVINVILGKELFPHLPVWRMSSNHSETPVDRTSRGQQIKLTVKL